MLGYLNAISTEWVIHADELIYQEVATRIYLSQTDKKLLNVHKWGTWLNMLKNRPRLRTNGFYSLRTSYWKPPCNDAFWEEKKREFTEVSHYVVCHSLTSLLSDSLTNTHHHPPTHRILLSLGH